MAVKKAAKAMMMMMMAVAGLLVMDMVVPRLAAKNGKGFCLSGGSLYHRSGIDHDAGFAQRPLRETRAEIQPFLIALPVIRRPGLRLQLRMLWSPN